MLLSLPIGDNYTMGPEDAARAAQTIRAKKSRSNPLQYVPCY